MIFTRFLFGSHSNLFTPTAISNIPLYILHNKWEEFFSGEPLFLKKLAEYNDGYQYAKLLAYKHPTLGIVLWFYGEHETGHWSYLLKPVREEIPEIKLIFPK